MKHKALAFSKPRFWVAAGILLAILSVLLGRVLYLDIVERSFLETREHHQSEHYKYQTAKRGIIFDRNHVPLAVSTNLNNVVLDPKVFSQHPEDWQKLADVKGLHLDYLRVKYLTTKHPNSRYQIAKKGVAPEITDQLKVMRLPGVYIEPQPMTFYPIGKATAQVVGFTNVKNAGQDGLELAFNEQLAGVPGKEEVTENAIGQVLSIDKILSQPKNGKDITLSIDSRIQFIAYKALKDQILDTHAEGGSAVVLDPKTGEVLAAVSYPDFNPNSVAQRSGPGIRDRAITDTFEPGSTVKVITLAVALESGKYTPTTPVDTRPGYYYIGKYRVRDDANFGLLDLTGVLTKSSNVGVSKVALSLPRKEVYDMFLKAGVGQNPGGEFPGTASGKILPYDKIGKFVFATMTYGYALTMSNLQVARLYAAIADQGIIRPISFLKQDQPEPGTRIISPKVSSQLIDMLKTVMGKHGTGLLANIPGYTGAGKTGTSHQVGPHGYYKHRYNTMFVGMIPAEDPRVVISVRINNPKGYYNGFGAVSAAPVFAKIAAASMSLLGVPPTHTEVDRALFRHQRQHYRALTGA